MISGTLPNVLHCLLVHVIRGFGMRCFYSFYLCCNGAPIPKSRWFDWYQRCNMKGRPYLKCVLEMLIVNSMRMISSLCQWLNAWNRQSVLWLCMCVLLQSYLRFFFFFWTYTNADNSCPKHCTWFNIDNCFVVNKISTVNTDTYMYMGHSILMN